MCEYCHDAATYHCPNKKCEGYRKHACKRCGMEINFTCNCCGSKMVEDDE